MLPFSPPGGEEPMGVIKCGCAERGCRLKPAFHCGRNAGFSRQLRTYFQSHPFPSAAIPGVTIARVVLEFSLVNARMEPRDLWFRMDSVNKTVKHRRRDYYGKKIER